MNVNHSQFVKLTFAIAAATAACSATPAADDAASGSAVAGFEPGGKCTTNSITDPGKGSGSAPQSSFSEGYCFDLARWQGAPDEEGVTDRFDPFIHNQCFAWSTQLQPRIAAAAKVCLDDANQRRKRDVTGEATEPFDGLQMYACGINALASICEDGIDGRVKSTCQEIVAAQNNKGNTLTLNACMANLTGLRPTARPFVKACATDPEQPFELFSCLESIRVESIRGCLPGRLEPSRPEASECEKVTTKATGTTEAFKRFIASQCESYRTKFAPIAASAALACLTNSKDIRRNVYECGRVGLNAVCLDSAVDARCNQIVGDITSVDPKANNGGRITRQCRSLLSGLEESARTEVSTCVPAKARLFGAESAKFALYSCIEGL